MSNKTIEKLLAPSFEYNKNTCTITKEEKIEVIKQRFNLSHGKGKYKKKNKKRK